MKINSFHEKNKKKKFIIIFSVVCMMLVVGVFLYTSYAWFESEKVFNSFSGNVGNVGDIYFSIYVDGVASNFVPSSYDRINFDHAECTNGATVTWDNDSWAPIVNNLTISRTKCTLFFADNSASTVITKLVGDADSSSTDEIDNGTDASGCTNTLAYDDYENLRYTGANPCNYVTFNDESAGWRIIGVFDGYVKLVRNGSIGNYIWDSSSSDVNSGLGINQWGESDSYQGADLMKLLNPGYEDNFDYICDEDPGAGGVYCEQSYVNGSIYWQSSEGQCYFNGSYAARECCFDGYCAVMGINENARNMIDDHYWYVGAVESNNNDAMIPLNLYEAERGYLTGKTCSYNSYCNDEVERTTDWNGYIGLIYPSDYGYASGGINRQSCLSSSINNSACSSSNWLSFKNGSENARYYTLTPYSGDYASEVVEINSSGYWSEVYPSLYLKSHVQITGGNGSQTNPYILSLE